MRTALVRHSASCMLFMRTDTFHWDPCHAVCEGSCLIYSCTQGHHAIYMTA